MEKFKNFALLTRMYALPVTLTSCFLIFAYAHYSIYFRLFNFILLVIALCCLHLGGNLFDDLIDLKLKAKKDKVDYWDVVFEGVIPKAQLIIDGTYTLKQVNIILLVLFSIALLIGIHFIILGGWKVLLLMIIGGILTVLYPIASKFYLAELILGLIYGPLMIAGGYYALVQRFDFNLFFLSLVVGLTIIIFAHVHSVLDWEYDAKHNKKTICQLLKTKNNAIKALRYAIALCYALIVFGVFRLEINPNILLVFLTLPLCTQLIKSLEKYINIIDSKLSTLWYYGFFENWNEIDKTNLRYYMYRFYLARNFSIMFTTLIAASTFLML